MLTDLVDQHSVLGAQIVALGSARRPFLGPRRRRDVLDRVTTDLIQLGLRHRVHDLSAVRQSDDDH